MVLHRCNGEPETCFCMYDPLCTGEIGTRLIPLPKWIDRILRPRYHFKVWLVRQEIRRSS